VPANTFQGLHARYYDLIYAQKAYAGEARFVHELLGGRPGRLLDVACGSGRHAREFAALGWEVVGVDYSADLLELAHDLEVHRQDMRELEVPGGPFDAVTCLFDSIGSPQGNDGVVAALTGRRRHRAPGGRTTVEFLHAPALISGADPVRVRRFDLPDGGTLVRISETTLDEVAFVMHVDYEVLELGADGSYRRETERQSNRFFAVEEMRALMQLAGLRVERFVPAYEDGEIGADTFHVMALAEPT
jgi:SAM-dependent methyltransferase